MPEQTATTSSNISGALPAPFNRYRPLIDHALRERFCDSSLPGHGMISYAMGWRDIDGNPISNAGGKFLRPTLCLLACEATGGHMKDALPAAVALELIHNFSLIHDDIQDRDEMRHHRPTVWSVWGDAKALVAGNAMRTIADMTLSQLKNGEEVSITLEVNRLLTAAYLEMIEGQYLDMSFEGRHDIGIGDYLDMISRKTGALIRCSLTIGSLIGSHDDSTVNSFNEAGRSLGFVFQIVDDLLGVWGDPQFSGKPVGADIRRRKNSFPVAYAMEHAKGKDRDTLLRIYSQAILGDKDVSDVLGIMDRLHVRENALKMASQQSAYALETLDSVILEAGPREELVEIINFLMIRQY